MNLAASFFFRPTLRLRFGPRRRHHTVECIVIQPRLFDMRKAQFAAYLDDGAFQYYRSMTRLPSGRKVPYIIRPPAMPYVAALLIALAQQMNRSGEWLPIKVSASMASN